MSTTRSIFISYRRDDASYPTDFIYRALAAEFGQGSVFKDDDSIPAGVDFRKYIDTQMSQCQVLLAVMGKSWLDARDKQGERRLENPADFVLLEIEAALKQDIAVIPVLVDGARVPHESELSGTLKDLVYRNGRKVRPGL